MMKNHFNTDSNPMEQDIPLRIEILSTDEDDQYSISSSKEIEFILRSIAQNHSRIALYYSDADEFILTTLLGVDATGLWLGQGQKAQEVRHISDSKHLIFVSSHNQVKIQFSTTHAREEIYEGQAAFFLAFPHSIHRLQRREYFRLIMPVASPLLCIIPDAKPVTTPPPLEVTIMDISGGGVGLTCAEQDTALVPGQTYKGCKIALPDIGELIGTIEVRNLVVLGTASGQTVRRAGCEFKELDSGSEILLQRYVTAMQRSKGKR